MAITGTGTGPFTVTGTETPLSLYNYVVAQNATNATKNSINTQFHFLRATNIGDGTTGGILDCDNVSIATGTSLFEVKVDGTLDLRNSRFDFRQTAVNAGRIRGTLLLNKSTISSVNNIAVYDTTTITATDSNSALNTGFQLVSTSNENPLMNFTRCNFFDAGIAGVDLVGNRQTFSSCKISNCAVAFRLNIFDNQDSLFRVDDYINDNNTYDIVADAPPDPYTCTLNVVGAYDNNLSPLNTLTFDTGGGTWGVNALVNYKWKYNLNCSQSGSALQSANVKITDNTNTSVFTGTTNSSGVIAQQEIIRTLWNYSETGVNKYPYTIKVRKYASSSQQLNWNCDNHTTQATVHSPVSYLTLTEAEALALTGISFAPSGATGGTVTLSSNHTTSDIWHAYRAWISQSSNFDSDDTWTYDGNTINIGGWSFSGNTYITSGSVVASNGTFVSIVVNGLIANSRVQIYNVTDSTELYNQVVSGTSLSVPVTWTANKTIRLRVTNVSGTTAYIGYTSTGLLTSAGSVFLVSQTLDTIYNTNGIDGSTVTEFTADYANIQIDVSDPDGVTTPQRGYSWYVYNIYTATGIANYFGALIAESEVNYKVVTSVVGIKLQNVGTLPVIIAGGRIYRDDGVSIIATGNSIQIEYGPAYIANSSNLLTISDGQKINRNVIKASKLIPASETF